MRFIGNIALALLLSGLLVSGLACGGEESESAALVKSRPSPRGVLDFIPYDIERTEVWDVKGILTSGIPEQEAKETEEYLRNYYLGMLAPFLNDVERIIIAERHEGKVWILEGNVGYEQIRDELGDERWEECQGYDLWLDGRDPQRAVAVIDNGAYVLLGKEGPVKHLLGSLKNGHGFLLDDENDAVGRTLVKAMEWGEGGTVVVWDDCRSDDFSECESLGNVVSLVTEEGQYKVKLVFVLLFRTELAAEDEAYKVEERLRKDFESGSVEDVFVDGEFVIVSTAADLEELYYPYLP